MSSCVWQLMTINEITNDTVSEWAQPAPGLPVKDLRTAHGGGGNGRMLKRDVVHARRTAPLVVNEICFGRCTSDPGRMCVFVGLCSDPIR